MRTIDKKTDLYAEIIEVVCHQMKSERIPRHKISQVLQQALREVDSTPLKAMVRDLTPISAMASITSRWHVEKGYVDRTGRPKPLTWDGKRGTLLRLARKVVGSRKAKAAVNLLVDRRLLVRSADGRWLPKAHVLRPGGLDRPQILRAAVMLQRLLRTISYNSARRYRGDKLLFEVMTRIPRLPPVQLSSFKRFVRAQGMLYVRAVDDWLESRNMPREARGARQAKEAGVVVFAFEEPTVDA